MKKIKFILLVLVMILFSGCSVKYNLYINDDLTVNEEVVTSESSSTLKTLTGQDPKVATNSIYNYYKIDGVKYSISTVSDDSSTSSTVSTSFKSLEDYEDYFKSDIVDNVNITKKGSYITIEYKQNVPLNDYSSQSLIYDDIEVNIEVPFKVTENNADYVKGNTYTWNISKNDELKDIKITFNKDETDISKKINILGFFDINVKYSVLFVLGFVIIILIIVLAVYRQNKKNNRF